jgi:hypothetical protein
VCIGQVSMHRKVFLLHLVVSCIRKTGERTSSLWLGTEERMENDMGQEKGKFARS